MSRIILSSQAPLPDSPFQISHRDPILLLGSCFSTSIGKKLEVYKFNSMTNPFGIVYNPISITTSLNRIIRGDQYLESDLNFSNNKWFSFDHHGEFSASDKQECLEKINSSITATHNFLKKSNLLIITLGSAWVYDHPKRGVVANCHKIPGKEFNKRLLSVKEIITQFEPVLKELNGKTIIFTISPVRHIRDGLHENNISKSVLHLAVHNLIQQNDNCFYFPSYEIFIDELRDYRFCKRDLTHPTDLSIDYIWNKFSDTYFNDRTKELIKKILELRKALQHNAFDPKSDQHQKFLSKQTRIIKELENNYPNINLEIEKKNIDQQLIP